MVLISWQKKTSFEGKQMFSMNVSVALESYFLKKGETSRKNLLRTLAKKDQGTWLSCRCIFCSEQGTVCENTHLHRGENNRRIEEKYADIQVQLFFVFPRFPTITHVLMLVTPEWEHLWRYCICIVILELCWNCCVTFSELWVKRKVKPDKFSLHQHIVFSLPTALQYNNCFGWQNDISLPRHMGIENG